MLNPTTLKYKKLYLGLGFFLLVIAQKVHTDDQSVSLKDEFIALLTNPEEQPFKNALVNIEKHWDNSQVAMAIETYQYTESDKARALLGKLLSQSIDTRRARNFNDFYFKLWNEDIEPSADYADFKAALYKNIDPRFEKYFLNQQSTARIRLDEIRWGGVQQDGIPPLRNPKMIAAEDADYLEDDNIVFGISINGDARAYPKRILAWHEMFTDTIGGVPIAGVYCTLCGTVIPYRTEVDGKIYQLGTSGFLYRSNKLMYDQETHSLWSTERGEPVLGPLARQGLNLSYESVVTTTWAEWKKRNPTTTVLSINTGHERDYGEGVAYSDYFSNDTLMFNTPFKDRRLKNKQEVLALRFFGAPNDQMAIDTKFLKKTPLYKNQIGNQKFIVITDKTGANRVYDPKNVEFVEYDGDLSLIDSDGIKWAVSEERLEDNQGNSLERLPYHRAFWFGWHAAYPETKLIK